MGKREDNKRVKELELLLDQAIAEVKSGVTGVEFVRLYSVIRDCRNEIRDIVGEEWVAR